MSKLDKKKEEIAKYKFYLGIVVAAIFGCIGWLVNSYEKASLSLVIADMFLIFAFSYGAIRLDRLISKNIDELEELKMEYLVTLSVLVGFGSIAFIVFKDIAKVKYKNY